MDFPRAPKHFETHPSGFLGIPQPEGKVISPKIQNSIPDNFGAKQFTYLKSEISLFTHLLLGEDINLAVGIQVEPPAWIASFFFCSEAFNKAVAFSRLKNGGKCGKSARERSVERAPKLCYVDVPNIHAA